MTNEEAIKLISMIDVCDYELHAHTHWGSFDDDMKEALKFAIEGLKAWEKLIKFVDSERENNGTLRVHINDIKKFYKEIGDAICD